MRNRTLLDMISSGGSSTLPTCKEDMDLRRGPWTVEEDLVLVNYIAAHGEGRWNSLARCSGLKRTGKSCRLRWLNYLRPDVRCGNITSEEQLLILQLHSQWGNRWSKIAQQLPGRTDNEIKNYWRTRVQKHANQLKCDVNSKPFKDVMRYLWMPRLRERIRAADLGSTALAVQASSDHTVMGGSEFGQVKRIPVDSCGTVSSLGSSSGTHLYSPVTVTAADEDKGGDPMQISKFNECWWPEQTQSPCGYRNMELSDFDWFSNGVLSENLWSLEDNWVIQQQHYL